MKRLMALLLVAAASATPATPAAAASCPNGFHLHTLGDGDHEHGEHEHVGVRIETLDRNENGYICVKHVSQSGAIHIHLDDNVP